MAFIYEKKRRIFLSGEKNGGPSGKPLLVCSFYYPNTGRAEYDGFILQIVEGCQNWAENSLFPLLSREYDADPDPKKRFFPASRYSLEFETTSEEPFSTVVRASLRLFDGKKVSSRHGFVFSTEDGGLLPPEAFFDRRTLSRYRRSLSRGYCVVGGKFFALGDKEYDLILIDNLINVKSKENN